MKESSTTTSKESSTTSTESSKMSPRQVSPSKSVSIKKRQHKKASASCHSYLSYRPNRHRACTGMPSFIQCQSFRSFRKEKALPSKSFINRIKHHYKHHGRHRDNYYDLLNDCTRPINSSFPRQACLPSLIGSLKFAAWLFQNQ